jgi:hypothetical protein
MSLSYLDTAESQLTINSSCVSLAWGNSTDLIKGQLFGQSKGGCVGNFMVCLKQVKHKAKIHEVTNRMEKGHGDQKVF